MITQEELALQIRGLEAQLTVLKARIKQDSTVASSRTFADLYGVLAGKSDSTAEEIDATLCPLKWDGEESVA
jgi:hypothetical protein